MTKRIDVRHFQAFARRKAATVVAPDEESNFAAHQDGWLDSEAVRYASARRRELREQRELEREGIEPEESGTWPKGTISNLIELLSLYPRSRAVKLHRTRVVELWGGQIDECGFPIDWSEGHERCWRCAETFTGSELKKGPFYTIGTNIHGYQILLCAACQPEADAFTRKSWYANEPQKLIEIFCREAIEESRASFGANAGLYFNNHGTYWAHRLKIGKPSRVYHAQELPDQKHVDYEKTRRLRELGIPEPAEART